VLMHLPNAHCGNDTVAPVRLRRRNAAWGALPAYGPHRPNPPSPASLPPRVPAPERVIAHDQNSVREPVSPSRLVVFRLDDDRAGQSEKCLRLALA